MTPTKPIIVNDLVEASEKDKETNNRLIYTRYDTDLLSNIPSCECGATQGAHLIGEQCPECPTKVTEPMNQKLDPFLWIRSPKGLPEKGLINPKVLTMFRDRFRRSTFDTMRWLTDVNYHTDAKKPYIVEQLIEMGIPRGYINFVNNFDQIVEILFSLKEPGEKKEEDFYLYELVRSHRHKIFNQYLPIPNRSMMILDSNNQGNFIDATAKNIIATVRNVIGIDTDFLSLTHQKRENRTIKTLMELSEVYQDFDDSLLASKFGLFRKQVYSGRSHFTCRAVITSITAPHHYRNIEIPWGVGVSMFRIHLVNYLFAMGYTANEAIAFLNEHAMKYHPLLDEMFQRLIAECPYQGIPVLFVRNPSLQRGSLQNGFISKVKTDVRDQTIGISILIVRPLNADERFFKRNKVLPISNDRVEFP